MSYALDVVHETRSKVEPVYIMECGNHKASLMRAERLVGEQVFALPPGKRLPVFPIAALPGCPDGWVKAAGSYVCPVDTNWGLWFDFTMNDEYNTAIIPSVKGMNPITGQKIDSIRMEQYQNKCPIHNTEFSHGRYCEQCDYKWPAQNYVAYPNTLWWDGFRSPDGHVRQFFFSEEEKRDIAALVMGKENTVPAFGFVFYTPKNPRVVEKEKYKRFSQWSNWSNHQNKLQSDNKISIGNAYTSSIFNNNEEDIMTVQHYSATEAKTSASLSKCLRNVAVQEADDFRLANKEVSVGAGAKIDQDLSPDNLSLEQWSEKEAAIIRLYFVFEPQFRDILSKGTRDISGTDTGYLEGLPLG